jgi:hypothetical protein
MLWRGGAREDERTTGATVPTEQFTFRALPEWPYPPTRERRSRWTFKAGWDDTLSLLRREIRHLDGRDCIIAAGFRERDLRLDGLPRANALSPQHPGIEISFTTKLHGRLVYATDVCERWEHNVRSIALGLESLRAVDRYGITRRGEQYAGWRQIGSGTTEKGPSAARGRQIIAECGGEREALRRTHPDLGGDPIEFQSVQLARA